MKKSAILWSILAVVFCGLAVEHGRSFAAGPFEFTPNWLTIIPAVAFWLGFIAFVIRKERTVAEIRVRKAEAELAELRERAPLAHLT
jgi:hypothetical protein